MVRRIPAGRNADDPAKGNDLGWVTQSGRGQHRDGQGLRHESVQHIRAELPDQPPQFRDRPQIELGTRLKELEYAARSAVQIQFDNRRDVQRQEVVLRQRHRTHQLERGVQQHDSHSGAPSRRPAARPFPARPRHRQPYGSVRENGHGPGRPHRRRAEGTAMSHPASRASGVAVYVVAG